MQKKESNNLTIEANNFNKVLGLIDELRKLTKDKDYTYSVRFEMNSKQWYIAKWVGNTEVILRRTYSKDIESLIDRLALMVYVLDDFTAELNAEIGEGDELDEAHREALIETDTNRMLDIIDY